MPIGEAQMNKMIITRQTTYSLNDIKLTLRSYDIYLLLTVKKHDRKICLNSTDKRGNEHGKITTRHLNEKRKTAIDKIISAISNHMRLEPMQLTPVSVLSFPGLEIRQSQRRVFQETGHELFNTS